MPSFHDAETPEDVPGGDVVVVLSEQEEREQELVASVVELLNQAVTIERSVAVKLIMCHMCGGWGNAHLNCPVPALEQWLSERSA